MAVTRTGSVTTIQTASQTGSQSVTVPNDAEIMIVKIAGALESSYISGGTYTLNSQSLTSIFTEVADATDIAYKVSPSTGSQTFAWDLGSAPAFGNDFFEISFYKGIDSSPIGATAYALWGDNIDTANTGEMTVASGDAVVAIAWILSVGDPLASSADWTNATEVSDETWAMGVFSGTEAFPSGNVTITVAQNGGQAENNFVQLMAAVIKQSSSGGGAIKNIMQYRVLLSSGDF